jgi:hypothetical protein
MEYYEGIRNRFLNLNGNSETEKLPVSRGKLIHMESILVPLWSLTMSRFVLVFS